MPTFENSAEWERMIVLELNLEHQHICRVHKVKLRPISVALFDSETVWGRFDSVAHTIWIARRLVRDFAWHQVLGVFRHEVAHQYVAEHHPEQASSETPHSRAFKEACRRLGVPAQFAKAGLDLKNGSLDWRSEPQDEATEKILNRTRKLLALANSTDEHEASLAMERVREMYAKYNLENLQGPEHDSFFHLVITHGKKRMEAWERRAVGILLEHFFVKVLTLQQFDAKTGRHVHAIEIIGTRENVLMAEYVYHFLLSQVEFLVQKAAAGEPGLHRTERTSYRLGVLTGFAKKLKQAETTTSSPVTPTSRGKTAEPSVTGAALIKFRTDTRLDNYIDTIHPRLRAGRRGSVTVHSSAYRAGQAAGHALTLHKPITSAAGNQGRVLTGSR